MGIRGRYAYWFPLGLLGFLILGGLVLTDGVLSAYSLDGFHVAGGGWYGTGEGDRTSTAVMVQTGFAGSGISSPHTLFPLGYWLSGILAVFLATVFWYGWRSGRARAFTWIAICGMTALTGFVVFLGIAEARPELGPTLGGSLATIGICAAAWVYFRLGPGH